MDGWNEDHSPSDNSKHHISLNEPINTKWQFLTVVLAILWIALVIGLMLLGAYISAVMS